MAIEKPRPGAFSKDDPQRAREMQIRSTEKKKENRDRRLALENCLAESVRVIKDGDITERAKGTQMMRGLVDMALNGDIDAIKLILKVTGELTNKVDLSGGGTPFEVKVVQTTPELKDKVNEYLDGGGLDG